MPAKFQSTVISAKTATAGSAVSVVSVFANGTAYWIDTKNGKLVGRQFLGFESFAPKPIQPIEGNEFLAYDSRHRELIRVKAEMATVIWRQPLGAPLGGEPTIRGGELFCATQTGRLLQVDLQSGEVVRSVQLAEPIRAGPTVSIDDSTIYAVTDRGNLFAFDAKSFRSRGAGRLGVRRGAVSQTPIEIGANLAMVDNSDADNPAIRLLAGAAAGSAQPLQVVSLAGNVSTPLFADGKRLFVATDLGEISVFAPSGPPTAPFVKTASVPPDSRPELQPRFLALRKEQFLVGGKGIAAYDASSGGKLRPIWQRFADESVIAFPSVAADSVVV
ncbi:MAG TPA: PQQ-binding-like beta-propeller repeat protein, partial [Pirellulales bacterium]|nr:PQQ-binding-like beta-propeller repeat protein [Pirellulales bacterium]